MYKIAIVGNYAQREQCFWQKLNISSFFLEQSFCFKLCNHSGSNEHLFLRHWTIAFCLRCTILLAEMSMDSGHFVQVFWCGCTAILAEISMDSGHSVQVFWAGVQRFWCYSFDVLDILVSPISKFFCKNTVKSVC